MPDYMEKIHMDNPINYRDLVWPAIMAIFVFLLTTGFLIWEDGFDMRILIIVIPLSVFGFILTGCVWNCIRRPKTVEITEDGLILNMRYGRRKELVDWNDIKYLNIFIQTEGATKGRDGYIYYGNNIRRTLYRPIVLTTRERYKEKYGKYPLMLKGYEK
jgi:hypothetical protein